MMTSNNLLNGSQDVHSDKSTGDQQKLSESSIHSDKRWRDRQKLSVKIVSLLGGGPAMQWQQTQPNSDTFTELLHKCVVSEVKNRANEWHDVK
ncbi:hypothetical protein [Natribacillus halophilus]|uniref:Uncharacterized protein n=1 Tax=Natribacillus halophilus TaxID=549003 RepID=A0A1G8QPA9_9BACI|nr:hypothetical protein [Natribacillus halophilus]SDJ06215.1 hypothetical protein SAMN04488123_11316 [Natribacillus halophilus]